MAQFDHERTVDPDGVCTALPVPSSCCTVGGCNQRRLLLPLWGTVCAKQCLSALVVVGKNTPAGGCGFSGAVFAEAMRGPDSIAQRLVCTRLGVRRDGYPLLVILHAAP